ncbi:probable E3 ubiquitin-protein ligase HIP1 isoform X1 [Lactuca sativa]|uniref:RING-type E3 ubiquitin transferase n=1 Tax=Lactuca sativa TaxID=4236 RepID=A0A9R1X4D3_LACSA|nr:probable E3 ubiquitin-protein ligase HIP1 isoform X1 [Lactuca sativa]XP_023737147.1 probable E3 ubiquitin-protein ligase HIP1 isoform X1 [Lactuca sativa]KAJ0198846.1 hypothetical protein LSAT_V11C600304440 [Lactuca sativa]
MDSYSAKRAVNWVSALRKGSGPSTRDTNGTRDEPEPIQFCNRIGCSGRLNHTKHTPNQILSSPKRPSSRSSNIKEVATNVKKPLHESKKKLSSKPEIEQLKTSATNHKSKSKGTESNGRTNGQKSGVANYDAQIGSSRRNTVKKRSTEGETSSSRGKKMSEPLSVRTRRSVNLNGNNQSVVQSNGETSSDGSNHHGLSSMMTAGYNVDAIANVLLALERIDQDEGLTYEQILSFDGNSFVGGFNLYDQHRDMRLDIDNMSYEELLALEEEMGIVSTALSEEELSKCLKISIYEPLQIKESRTKISWCLDESKCSICQEEFIAGDEIGRMGCNHGYHAVCVNQWLQLKNWCPVCKASAKP